MKKPLLPKPRVLPQRFVENAALKKTLQKDSTKKLR